MSSATLRRVLLLLVVVVVTKSSFNRVCMSHSLLFRCSKCDKILPDPKYPLIHICAPYATFSFMAVEVHNSVRYIDMLEN
jgi:hypothetical protein